MLKGTFRLKGWKKEEDEWNDIGKSFMIVPLDKHFFSVAQQSKLGLDRPIVEVYRSYTATHTHMVGLLWTRDQLVAEAALYTTHSKHNRRTSKPSTGFEPTIQTIKQLPTSSLESTAIAIGLGTLLVLTVKKDETVGTCSTNRIYCTCAQELD